MFWCLTISLAVKSRQKFFSKEKDIALISVALINLTKLLRTWRYRNRSILKVEQRPKLPPTCSVSAELIYRARPTLTVVINRSFRFYNRPDVRNHANRPFITRGSVEAIHRGRPYAEYLISCCWPSQKVVHYRINM